MALAAILLSFATTAKAQTAADSMDVSFTSIKADSVADNALSPIKADSVYKVKRDWSTWRPNPKRAMWLAIVLPGADRSITASIGSCRLCMADSWVASTPCVGTIRCTPTTRRLIST